MTGNFILFFSVPSSNEFNYYAKPWERKSPASLPPSFFVMIAIIIMESLLEKINRYWTLEWDTDSLRYHSHGRRERAQFTLDTFCAPSLSAHCHSNCFCPALTCLPDLFLLCSPSATLRFVFGVDCCLAFRGPALVWLAFPAQLGQTRSSSSFETSDPQRMKIFTIQIVLWGGGREKKSKKQIIFFFFPLFSFLVFCLVDLTFTFFFSSSLRYLSFKFLFSSFLRFPFPTIVLIIKEDPRARQRSSEGGNRSVSKPKEGKTSSILEFSTLFCFLCN